MEYETEAQEPRLLGCDLRPRQPVAEFQLVSICGSVVNMWFFWSCFGNAWCSANNDAAGLKLGM